MDEFKLHRSNKIMIIGDFYGNMLESTQALDVL